MTGTETGSEMPTLAFDGVLFFPVTPFDDNETVNEQVLYSHVANGVAKGAGAVFVACGTGEFHALSLDEYETVVRVGVEATNHHVPVLAGVGGSIGQAREMVAIAERLGVDGFLVLPPYLVQGPQDGVARYVEEIAASTTLPLIAYHRGLGALTLPIVEQLCALPNLAGVKDGVGDIALMQQFVSAARRLGRTDLQFFNGLLTAEASQAAYTAIGVHHYSSSVFAMAPDIAIAFYTAHRAGDLPTQSILLDEFYTPLIGLRNTTPGFGVSLIKAGLNVSGVKVGSVRAPLSDPNSIQVAELSRLLARGRQLVTA